ncbi:MAG TPA: SDR family oxidoreductase [Terriglobales bacterium]|nr:SDR family oxidoreductase [Terriglobales bacterium]
MESLPHLAHPAHADDGRLPRSPDSAAASSARARPSNPVYWRVEGSLLELTTVRPIAFFTWNSQTFIARAVRRSLVLLMAVLRPFLYAANRIAATRIVHAVLRGITRDRLDLLGEEEFEYKLKPLLKEEGVRQLKALQATGADVVLVSQGLEHVMRPLARHLGVRWIIANRLDFRDGVATGRLLSPVIRPRGIFARIREAGPDGQQIPARWVRALGLRGPKALAAAIVPAVRVEAPRVRPIVYFDETRHPRPFSVRKALTGKRVLLIGVTGFIGKVWLANTLMDLPEIGKLFLLIRRQKSSPAQKRFEKMIEASPVFDPLFEKYGDKLGALLADKVEVVEGDVSQPGVGLNAETAARLGKELDLIINSSGLTDFNPDLREALAVNVDSSHHLIEFIRSSDHAALLHLSTCYVAGQRDGRVSERVRMNYTPAHLKNFDSEKEWQRLHQFVESAEARAESPEVTEELRQQALGKEHAAKGLSGQALDNQVRKNRVRWLKTHLTEEATRRAQELGWPNTYTFTKSLAESLIAKYGAGLPIAIVRPAIVETSVSKPFRGWNEGINTSASLSYLLGTSFRQLPSNERKRLDIIPVDAVCNGMTLIGAALVERRHDPMYQLATSVTNPCDMGRSIELTSLGHRRHYRAQEGLEYWLRLRLDAIPVSKERYQRMSAPAQKMIIKTIQRVMSPLPSAMTKPLAKTERNLERVEKLVGLFEPFILHNEHDFVADNVEKLSQALTPEEREIFGYDTAGLDWWEYWIDIHIPALRRWTYPLIEGRPLEARAPRELHMSPVTENGESDRIKTGTNGATWQYS